MNGTLWNTKITSWYPIDCLASQQDDLTEDTTSAHHDAEPVAGPSRPAGENHEAAVHSLPDLTDAVGDDA
ncbi:unnamed protein product [Leptidea sinapis]|uniref:Uncharacterized protein n=1 Tax=Leptidea sinapis TaxID=189913 RepID=A0A5E4PZK5_9NEOP|nr:unnamed protein product [Leptidea sinapis]